MAIVFISPKQRQKTLIFGIIGLVSLALIIIGLGVFLKKPKTIPSERVFKPPKIEISFEVLESDQVKNLEVFEKIKKEFNYQGKTEEGEIQSGKILALSREEALKLLKELGLSDIVLEEMEIGRGNPFVSYEITI